MACKTQNNAVDILTFFFLFHLLVVALYLVYPQRNGIKPPM